MRAIQELFRGRQKREDPFADLDLNRPRIREEYSRRLEKEDTARRFREGLKFLQLSGVELHAELMRVLNGGRLESFVADKGWKPRVVFFGTLVQLTEDAQPVGLESLRIGLENPIGFDGGIYLVPYIHFGKPGEGSNVSEFTKSNEIEAASLFIMTTSQVRGLEDLIRGTIPQPAK